MLYISSSCVKHEKIRDSIEELARNGFSHIELSGGTKYYDDFEKDLLGLQDKYHLNYLLHNYFPPPKEDFILNLASLNDDIFKQSVEHIKRALELSKRLKARKFAFHAGFFIDFSISEIGKSISSGKLADTGKAIQRFCEGFRQLKQTAEDVELYIENNVFSSTNAQNFQGKRPFMLMEFKEYEELKRMIDCKLLLDVAHLKVSANTLKLDFFDQVNKMLPLTDYLHISENDGLQDQSHCFAKGSMLLETIKKYDLRNKAITAETYGSMDEIKESFDVIQSYLNTSGLANAEHE
jgi:sugar phosphate isomerase/epimerase